MRRVSAPPPQSSRLGRESGVWIAECDALGLVTEADSYEALVQRVREVAPELAELNGLSVESQPLRLRFVEESTAQAANTIQESSAP